MVLDAGDGLVRRRHPFSSSRVALLVFRFLVTISVSIPVAPLSEFSRSTSSACLKLTVFSISRSIHLRSFRRVTQARIGGAVPSAHPSPPHPLLVNTSQHRNSPQSYVSIPSLLLHELALSSSPSLQYVEAGSELCSVFKIQTFRAFTGCVPPLHLSSLLHKGRCKSSTAICPTFWLHMETNDYWLLTLFSRRSISWYFTTQRFNFAGFSSATYVLEGIRSPTINLIKIDKKLLGLVSIVLWIRHGNVGGWSPCFNPTTAHSSTTVKPISQVIEVDFSHSSTKPRSLMKSLVYMELTSFVHSNEYSGSGVHGTSFIDRDTLLESPSPLSNQRSIHSSSSSHLSRTYATVSPSFVLNIMFSGIVEIHLVSQSIFVSIKVELAYLLNCIAKFSFSRSIVKACFFRGQSGASKAQGSTTEFLVRSLLVAEAITLRPAFPTALNLEIPTLKMFFDNSTLVRAINNDTQSKEIYGIVKAVQQLSSGFVDISFLQLHCVCNGDDAECLAYTRLKFSLVMDPVWVGLWA